MIYCTQRSVGTYACFSNASSSVATGRYRFMTPLSLLRLEFAVSRASFTSTWIRSVEEISRESLIRSPTFGPGCTVYLHHRLYDYVITHPRGIWPTTVYKTGRDYHCFVQQTSPGPSSPCAPLPRPQPREKLSRTFPLARIRIQPSTTPPLQPLQVTLARKWYLGYSSVPAPGSIPRGQTPCVPNCASGT